MTGVEDGKPLRRVSIPGNCEMLQIHFRKMEMST
jgi:hypothetical protein